MKLNKKIVFYKVLLVLLLVAAVIVIGLIINKHNQRKIYEDKNKEIVKEFKGYMAVQENQNTINSEEMVEPNIEFEGHKVIGIITIPKIDLEYPILDETTNATMKIAISKYWGKKVNDYGNISLAGHNNYDGTMFGKNKKLQIGDTIQLTDLLNNTVEYEIYEIFSTDPNDVSILKTETPDVREVTLITCTNGRKERLIIKAQEK